MTQSFTTQIRNTLVHAYPDLRTTILIEHGMAQPVLLYQPRLGTTPLAMVSASHSPLRGLSHDEIQAHIPVV
jgi:hypothetical protein